MKIIKVAMPMKTEEDLAERKWQIITEEYESYVEFILLNEYRRPILVQRPNYVEENAVVRVVVQFPRFVGQTCRARGVARIGQLEPF